MDKVITSVQWSYIPVIMLCMLALICAWRKRERKSFEILVINLYVENIIFLGTLVYASTDTDNVMLLVLYSINQYFHYLQCGTIVIITLQRLAIVYFPIKSNIVITMKKTRISLFVKYIVTFVLVGMMLILMQVQVEVDLPRISKLFLDITHYTMALIVLMGNLLIMFKIINCRRTSLQSSTHSRNDSRRKTSYYCC